MAGFFSRVGALVTAPRALARRDLDRRDGKAVDDLIVLAMVGLALDGAPSLLTAASLLAGGRASGALHRLADTLRPGAMLLLLWVAFSVAVWLCCAALLYVFTARGGRRAVGELGARVTAGYILMSLLGAPVLQALPAGRLSYVIGALPWAASALLFGLVLREALEPLAEPLEPDATRPPWEAPPRAMRAGLLAGLLVLVGGAVHVDQAVRAFVELNARVARPGGPAPAVDLPLLGGGKLQLASLRGRRVVLSFWATWCGPCLAELPALERAYRERGADAALLYAVNVDEPGPDREAVVRATVKRLGLGFPVALDDGSAAQSYSIASIPALVHVDEAGRFAEVVDRPLDGAALHDALR